MPTALDSGDVDAALFGEPFTTVATRTGARALTIGYAALGERIPLAGGFTSQQFAAQNPDVVRRFAAALEESQRYAEQHPDDTRAALDDYLQLPDGVAAELTLPGWDPIVDEARLQLIIDLSVRQGVIPDRGALDRLLRGRRAE